MGIGRCEPAAGADASACVSEAVPSPLMGQSSMLSDDPESWY